MADTGQAARTHIMLGAKSKKILKIISWQILALLLVLAACEGILRIGGMISTLKLKRHKAAANAANTRTVLCAGDSFVYGIGGEPFPKQLETILNTRQSQFKFTVHNTGLPGTGTTQMLAELENQLSAYAPEHLIILSGASNNWLQFTLPDKAGFNPLSHLKLWRFWKLHRFMTAFRIKPETRFPKGCAATVQSENDWFSANLENTVFTTERSPDSTDELRDYVNAADERFRATEQLIAARNAAAADRELQALQASKPPLHPADSQETRELADRIYANIRFHAASMLAHLYKNTDSAKSLKYFRETLELRPDYLYGMLHMASIYRLSGDSANFLRQIEALLKKDPNFVPAYTELAWYYYLKDDAETGLEYFAKAMALVPCSADTMSHMPFGYSELSRYLPVLEKQTPMIRYNPFYRQMKQLAKRLGDGSIDNDEQAINQLTEQDMLEAIELAKRYKTKLLMCSYPERSLPGVLSAVKKRNVRYIDFASLFKQNFRSRNEYIAFDKDHCNTTGYRFMAERFADEILASEGVKSQ